jgi:hypothetical protein
METHRNSRTQEDHPTSVSHLQAPDNAARVTIDEIREIAVQHLRRVFSELDQREPPSELWTELPKDYRTFIANLLHLKPGLPIPTSPPLLTFRCVDPDPYAVPFLRSLLQSQTGTWSTYADNPSPIQACHVATALLSGGTRSRIAAFFLLTTVCFDDSLPGSAEAHLYTSSILLTALQFGSATDKTAAELCLSILAEGRNETWLKILTHSTSSPDNSTGRRHVVESLLKAGCANSFSMLLGHALAHNIEAELSTMILNNLIANHLPGTPGLTMLLEKILATEDSDRKVAYGRLLSSIDGFTGNYWGRLAPWTFERPLQLLATQQLDPLTVREQLCPHIGLSTFLAAYNLTEGAPPLLCHLDDLFAPNPRLSDSENAWLTTQLRQSIIRASLLTPSERASAVTYLFLLSQDSSDPVLNITMLGDLLSASSVKQRLEFPALEVMRCMASSAELEMCPEFVTQLLPESADPDDQRHREIFLTIDLCLPPQQQMAHLSEHSPGTL